MLTIQQQNTAMVTLKTILTMLGKAGKTAARAIHCFNEKTAVVLTKIFQSMWTFWFTFLVLIGWIVTNAAGVFHFDPFPFVLLTTVYSSPQLPILVVMGVGVHLLGRQQEEQSKIQFDATMKTAKHTEWLVEYISAMDEEQLREVAIILRLLKTQRITINTET